MNRARAKILYDLGLVTDDKISFQRFLTILSKIEKNSTLNKTERDFLIEYSYMLSRLIIEDELIFQRIRSLNAKNKKEQIS